MDLWSRQQLLYQLCHTNAQGRIVVPVNIDDNRISDADLCGQSYKHFTLVNYASRVVIWGIFQSGTTLES